MPAASAFVKMVVAKNAVKIKNMYFFII
jgi:hypothetical protein